MPRGCHVSFSSEALRLTSPGYRPFLLRNRCGQAQRRVYRPESAETFASLSAEPTTRQAFPPANAHRNSELNHWNVEERCSPQRPSEGLAALGFKVGSTRRRVRV